ncbi:uncharacterized protein LOC125881297 [Epinephelus fuscoguttatus]|uniref:uncharacterized protein LOC125881297 n=1 Tax=Epinephelus fuscoguttatus TaxID=293821 RepID=UPI0020D1537E|nr:uncharacterized protein LOC125881297 [Epinephelus fuscoguttatus]
MDESALERYFNKFIANDSSKTEEEEKEKEKEDDDNEEFFRLLPDELLTLHKDDTATTTTPMLNKTVLRDSSTSQNYSSQNPTEAAKLPGQSPKLELVHPMIPVTPVTKQPKLTPHIVNVISTVKLGCRLDLSFIARNAWNVEFNPMVLILFQKFKALFMRIREPQSTAVIYESGIVVCTGTKSEEQSRLAARKFARKVQKLGFPARFLNFRIQNMVASYKSLPINLEQMASHEHCSYEPELFQALFYSGIPGVVITITTKGKIVLTGAKSRAEIEEALETIYPIVCRFRRHRGERNSD